MIRAYRYRLKPNNTQSILLDKCIGCSRFIYNWGLALRNEHYQKEGKKLDWVEICKQITILKKQKEYEWLKEVPVQSLQASIRNMDAAFTWFFKGNGNFPKFKSKRHKSQTFQVVSNVVFDFSTNRVKLPKIGKVKFLRNRPFKGKTGLATIRRTNTNKYYISINVDDGNDAPSKFTIREDTSIGIDVGLKDFAVLSNGQVFENPKYLEKAEKRLKVLQRRLSKKQKGSKRQEKARLAVAKAYEKVKNCRTDYIHKVSSKIIRENQTVIIEDLNIDGMMKNHNLAKHIGSVSWNEFFRQLQYKADWNGVNLIRIGRFEPSSKMCLCGFIYKELKLSDRKWICPSCGRINDRDLLAAINIKRFGLQKQQIGISPTECGVEGVEWSVLVDTVKRQYVKLNKH